LFFLFLATPNATNAFGVPVAANLNNTRGGRAHPTKIFKGRIQETLVRHMLAKNKTAVTRANGLPKRLYNNETRRNSCSGAQFRPRGKAGNGDPDFVGTLRKRLPIISTSMNSK